MSLNVRIGINPYERRPAFARRRNAIEHGAAEGKQIGYEGFELGNSFRARRRR